MAALLSHPRSRSAAPVFAGLAVGAVAAAVHVAAVREGPVARAAGHTGRVALELRLVRDPVALVSGHGRRFVLADADLGRLDGHAVRAPVLVIAHDRRWLDLLPGQRLRADGRLEPARHGDDVAALVVARGPPEPLGRPPWWQRLAGRVRSAFRTACRSLPADERGLVPGLVIGDVSSMP
jgi:competence protein ComEC